MDGQNFNNDQNMYQDNTNMTYQAPVEDNTPVKANGLQITSMVLGICSIVLGCCWSWLGIILGVVGLVLAIMGNKNGKHGIGTAGFVCSIIGLVLAILGIIIGAIFGSAALKLLEEMGYSADMLEQLGYR